MLVVEDPGTIAETIAALIGYAEGRDAAAIADDLTEAAGKEVAVRVGRALAGVGDGRGPTALR